jgi:hypothetical protein
MWNWLILIFFIFIWAAALILVWSMCVVAKKSGNREEEQNLEWANQKIKYKNHESV